MSIQIMNGFNLSPNDSAPGVLNYWIGNERMAPSTDTGAITAFLSETSSGAWLRYECAYGEGDWTSAPSAGSGGLEYVLTANYKIGGLDQTRLDLLNSILSSQRVSIVAEMSDGKFFYLSRNGAVANAAPIASGNAGGGAAAIGSTITFTAADFHAPRQVTVATTLDAITSDS